jgi:hypothetical protein
MTETLAKPLADRLLKSSARLTYDPDIEIDWEAGAVDGLYAMRPERMSLYGTRLWDRLDEDQRIELSKHEIASIASVGLWFELVLMDLLVREAYRSDPRSQRTHYVLTELADECRHSTMFGKAIGVMGLPAYGPRGLPRKLGALYPLIGRGASMYAATLIGEEPADRFQREIMNDPTIQPMVRMVMRIHVLEEARHVSFAREELIKSTRNLRRHEWEWHQFVTAQAAYVTMRSLVHPDVYAAVGIDPAEGRRAALSNPNYRATIAWMGEKVMPFLEEQGMVGKRHLKTWRASFLLPH